MDARIESHFVPILRTPNAIFLYFSVLYNALIARVFAIRLSTEFLICFVYYLPDYFVKLD